MPIGYRNGFSIEGKSIKKIKDRQYSWSFFGTYKSDRQELVDSFSKIENGKYILRDESSEELILSDDLVDYFIDSVFIPCSRGWSTVNTMRLYEASMCGSIPVVVTTNTEQEIAFKYEENPPWIFAKSWESAVEICEKLLKDEKELQSTQDQVLLWWNNRIGNIRKSVKECLIENQINKFKNFPKIYCVSLEENFERRNLLLNEFSKYGITEINFSLSKKYPENNHIIESEYLDNEIIKLRGADCSVSHIKTIDKWIKETDEEYAFFCEDDLSLETASYWNFTWDEFYGKLPEDWECVQLFIISEHFKVESLELIGRMWNFWGATAYIMKRDYAKKIVNNYYKDNKYVLNPVNEDPIFCYWNVEVETRTCPIYHKLPLVENILFTGIGKVYNCPLFVENVSIESTFVSGHKAGHLESHETILNSWKLHQQNKSSLQFMD
jgi:hypothetical protein